MNREHLLFRSLANAEKAARSQAADVRVLAVNEPEASAGAVLDGLCDLVGSRYQDYSPDDLRDGGIPPVVFCAEWGEPLRQHLALLKNLLYQGRPVNVLVYLAIDHDPRTVPTGVTEMFHNPPVSGPPPR